MREPHVCGRTLISVLQEKNAFFYGAAGVAIAPHDCEDYRGGICFSVYYLVKKKLYGVESVWA